MTPIDFFTFPSLRKDAIYITLAFVTVDIVYLAHNVVIDHLGLSLEINSVVMSLAELLAIPIAIYVIPYFKRLTLSGVMLGMTVIISFATAWVDVPSNCLENGYCSEGILQLLLIGAVRFFYSFFVCVLYIIMVELFPVSIRSMGVGIPPAFGGFGSMLSQLIFVSAFEEGINFFVVVSFFFLLNLLLILKVS